MPIYVPGNYDEARVATMRTKAVNGNSVASGLKSDGTEWHMTAALHRPWLFGAAEVWQGFGRGLRGI